MAIPTPPRDASTMPYHTIINISASQLQAGSPRNVFDSALSWADLASVHSDLRPMEAFRATIDLLPHLTWLGATTTQQYYDLSLVKNIAVRAAFTAICSSEYGQGLEWLEHARCVVWNRSLMLRSPVDSLALSYPDLAHRLQTVSRQLHCANFESQPSGTNPSSSGTIEHRHRLAREYNDVVSQVRDLPRFGDFLQRKKVSDLTRAACHGPIVVINCYEQSCDALIILPGKHDISHLPLPGFTEDAAQRSLLDLRSSLRRTGIRERGCRKASAGPSGIHKQ
ncbi:hypothetical protein BN14_11624 [Rhizoctonia solani AG-1 IB]|uniref:Uncharacterized protein n=1 Tax=Thanatephorus cucumeris (strain AG1-IB / isolate 7/3/14) TaxID=1108050 RepID=M5CBW8_THACB|nr:hypothetical protein BN14_11624 [Rhizoctonia solani AG-1 IB]